MIGSVYMATRDLDLEHLKRFDQLCQRISESLSIVGLSPEDVLASLPVVRDQTYKRHYGQVGESLQNHEAN